MTAALLLGSIVLLGFLCQWLAWKTRQPALIFLLLTGLFLGPATGVLNPDKLFDELLFPFVSLAVSIILFEGSLTLKRQELQDIGGFVWRMVSFGAIAGGVVIALAVYWLTDLPIELAALFGAVMTVTGPTVTVPLLSVARPSKRLSKGLRWEGIMIEPVGAIFAVLVFEWIVVQHTSRDNSEVVVVFLQTIAVGALTGIILASIYGLLLRHQKIPQYLQNFSAVAFVTAGFVLANSLRHESGLLTVVIMGIWLANMPGVDTHAILRFKETLTLIFVSGLFIVLAARVDLNAILTLGWSLPAVFIALQFFAQPLKAWVSTIGSDLSVRERAFLAWFGPRGIVAAAVCSLFALRLEQSGYETAELLVPLAFAMIFGTVLLQSLFSRQVAKSLKVAQPEAKGYLIIGANPIAIAVAQALERADVEVILCDSDWRSVQTAQMKGLAIYHGNPMSEHAETYLDISGIGGLLGMSSRHETNVAAALRFGHEFGRRNIFSLPSIEEATSYDKHRTKEAFRGKTLFDETYTYESLVESVRNGANINASTLTDDFGFAEWQAQHSMKNTLALFAKDTHGHLHWFCKDDNPAPEKGWTIYSLKAES